MLNLDADKFSNIFFKIILTIVSLILVVNIFGYFHELGYDGEHQSPSIPRSIEIYRK